MELIKLKENTKSILKNFIDKNENIISYAINPYGYLKFSISGNKNYYTVNNLKRAGYLKRVESNKENLYKLTIKGHGLVKGIMIEESIKKKQKNWDHKWHILIFDIPEDKKNFRNHIRLLLKEIGFYRLQKSVWIYPYDVLDYIFLLLPTAKEFKWFNHVVAEKINFEKDVKKYFKLD